MSIKLSSKVWGSTLPTNLKVVLGQICDVANNEAVCWPSQKILMHKISMTDKKLQKHIASLENLGLINRDRGQKGGRRQSDLYQVYIEILESVPEKIPRGKKEHGNFTDENFSKPNMEVFLGEHGNISGSFKEESSLIHNLEPSVDDGVKTMSFAVAVEVNLKRQERNQANIACWKAYAKAYCGRYGVFPIANLKTRAQTVQLVRYVGASVAPPLAMYYVSHPDAGYMKNRHEFGLFLKDYQSVLTDMQRNEVITQAQVRMAERTQSNRNSFQQIIKELQTGA